ncbi:hypothetical protein HMPREF9622_00834 [Cutibacterium modestum HL037PA3]|nr:hypothetical protein HMPREF9621_00447 [Cutibacterium modestum HL037PA2]EFT15974.1 hypothetical protein HMPREF9622_00834 [Cutibacterium modestum HL037PA3]
MGTIGVRARASDAAAATTAWDKSSHGAFLSSSRCAVVFVAAVVTRGRHL